MPDWRVFVPWLPALAIALFGAQATELIEGHLLVAVELWLIWALIVWAAHRLIASSRPQLPRSVLNAWHENAVQAVALAQVRRRYEWPWWEGDRRWDTPEQLWDAASQAWRDQQLADAAPLVEAILEMYPVER